MYKKERHQSWVSLTLVTQKLEFSFDSDINLLGAPWVSHGTSLGPLSSSLKMEIIIQRLSWGCWARNS